MKKLIVSLVGAISLASFFLLLDLKVANADIVTCEGNHWCTSDVSCGYYQGFYYAGHLYCCATGSPWMGSRCSDVI